MMRKIAVRLVVLGRPEESVGRLHWDGESPNFLDMARDTPPGFRVSDNCFETKVQTCR